MNYTHFTNATTIQPFSNQPGSKFTNITPVNTSGPGSQVIALLNTDDDGVQRIIQPIETSFPANFSINFGNGNNIGSNQNQVITLPLTVSGTKLDQGQAFQLQLVSTSSGGQVAQLVPIFTSQQTQDNSIHLQIQQVNETNNQDCSNDQRDNNNSNQVIDQQGIHDSNGQVINADIKPNISDLNQLQQQQTGVGTSTYPVTLMISPDMLLRDHISDGTSLNKDNLITQIAHAQAKNIQTTKDGGCTFAIPAGNVIGNSWPVVGSSDYIQSIQTEAVPLSIHQFLKLSAETIKRESAAEAQQSGNGVQLIQLMQEYDENGQLIKKKKYRKKVQKARRPRPGQVHIATALDGTLLFCCPECNMAYPEKEVLEQHLVSHKIERRFICDICGAGLKRKEHLERHKLGHNPERPFICTVCTKGFKRKEHLNLHAVIHSGEKTEICNECGKGFYRRDHLRKHAKSHQSKRLRDELQYQQRQLHTLEQQQKQLQLQQQLQAQKQREKFAAQSKQREDSNDGSMLLIHEDGMISGTCSGNEGPAVVGNEERYQQNGNAGSLYEHFRGNTNESLQSQRNIQASLKSVTQSSIDSSQNRLDGDDRLIVLQRSVDDNANESSATCNGQMDDSSSLKICDGIDNELKVTDDLMEPEQIL